MRIISKMSYLFRWVKCLSENYDVTPQNKILYVEYLSLCELNDKMCARGIDNRYVSLALKLLDLILFDESGNVLIHYRYNSVTTYINCRIYNLELPDDISIIQSKYQKALDKIRKHKALRLYNRIRLDHMSEWDF